MQRKQRFVADQRWDLSQYDSMMGFIEESFRSLNQYFVSSDSKVLAGWEIETISGLNIRVKKDQVSVLVLSDRSGHEEFHWRLATESDLFLSLGNNDVHYVEVQFVESTEDSSTVAFWDSQTNSEFSQASDQTVVQMPVLVSNTSGFTGDPDKVPLAVVTTSGGVVTGIVDSRPLIFALDSDFDFGIPRSDRAIKTVKNMFDALATSLKELKNTTNWYDDGGSFQITSEKGAANGYASLDGSGDVPDAQIPVGIQRKSERDIINGYPTLIDNGGSPAIAASQLSLAELLSRKDAASGYAGLDSLSRLVRSAFTIGPFSLPDSASPAADLVAAGVPDDCYYIAIVADKLGYPEAVYGTGGIRSYGMVTGRYATSNAYSYCYQEFRSVSASLGTYRRYSTSAGAAWSAWVQTSDTIDISRIVYGGNASATTNLANAGDLNAVTKSGFYKADNPSVTETPAAGGWDIIHVEHEPLNGYGFQIAVQVAMTDIWIRQKTAGSWGSWVSYAKAAANGIASLDGSSILFQSTYAGRIVAGGGSMNASLIDAGTFPQARIGAGAVGQSQLKTGLQQSTLLMTPGTTSITVTSGPYALNAFWSASAPDSLWLRRVAGITAGYASQEGVTNIDSSNHTYYFQIRYITASPPYDLGDGEIPVFVFLLLDASGNVVGVDVAPDPPWANNGPTPISPAHPRVRTAGDGKRYLRVPLVPAPGLGASASEREAFAECLCQPFDDNSAWQEIEIDQKIKNQDMSLVPHPWQGNDLGARTVVLLDPVSAMAHRMARLHDLQEPDQRPRDLLLDGALRVDNTSLRRAGPPGVLICGATWAS